MGEGWGVLAALLSSGLGGTSIGATRYLAGALDPLSIGAFRFGIGWALLCPIALLRGGTWPSRKDWIGAAALGALFFGLFPILFNASLVFTTAARGAIALSTLPLLTMVAGAVLGVERLTARKSAGVSIAMIGVAMALLTGLQFAPPGAWRGDLLMMAAACMALYNVWSRPFINRLGALPFTTMAMGVGAACLIALAALHQGFAPVAHLTNQQWAAVAYLGVIGGAATFLLWTIALGRTTPTRVAVSVTVNPITAAIVGALLLGEPLRWNVAAGLSAVAAGIWLATTSNEPVQKRDASRGPHRV